MDGYTLSPSFQGFILRAIRRLHRGLSRRSERVFERRIPEIGGVGEAPSLCFLGIKRSEDAWLTSGKNTCYFGDRALVANRKLHRRLKEQTFLWAYAHGFHCSAMEVRAPGSRFPGRRRCHPFGSRAELNQRSRYLSANRAGKTLTVTIDVTANSKRSCELYRNVGRNWNSS